MFFMFDTGSDWLWVPLDLSTCPSCQTPHHHTITPPDVDTFTKGSISYKDGSGVNGTIYDTSVNVGTLATPVI